MTSDHMTVAEVAPGDDADTEPSERPPAVSVVVPAYNREQFLPRCLDSVIAQTVTDWELVVSDDGSTDGTAAVAARYAAVDPRIRVVTADNGGVALARNRGFAASDPRSRYVTFLDSDDRWLPDTLEAMIAVLDARPDLVSVYGIARCIDGDDQLIPGDDLEERMRERSEFRDGRLVPVAPDHPTTFAGMVFHNYTSTPGLHLVRREVAQCVGPFDPETDPADDWDMGIRITRVGPIGFLDRPVLEWRKHEQALTSTSPRWSRAYWNVRAKSFTSPDNTPEQRQLARASYLASTRAAFSSAWSLSRGRRLGAAASAAAGGTACYGRYARIAAPQWLADRRRRLPAASHPATGGGSLGGDPR